jgi:hypothetical protein
MPMSEMGDEMDDEIREADLRNGEPGATTAFTNHDRPTTSAEPASADGPAPADGMELDRDPPDGRLPSDADVQAERQASGRRSQERGRVAGHVDD